MENMFVNVLENVIKDKLIFDENWIRVQEDNIEIIKGIEFPYDQYYVNHALAYIKSRHPEWLEKTGATTKFNQKSAAVREKANEFFKKKKWLVALKMYSKSIALAKSRSTELGFAYANRSALLFHRGYYRECLEDIERALQDDYPADKKSQLNVRKQKALELLSSQKKKVYCESNPIINIKNKNANISGAADSIKITENKIFGRYIEATRDIEMGEILLVEKPYCSLIYPEFKTTHCGECNQLCFNLIPCKSCCVEMYCSEHCREEALTNYHQYECIIMNFYPGENDKCESSCDNQSENMEKILRQLSLRLTLKGFKNYRSKDTKGLVDLYHDIGKLETHRRDLKPNALLVLAFNAAKQFYLLKKYTDFLSKFKFANKESILKYHLLRNRLICAFNHGRITFATTTIKDKLNHVDIGIGIYHNFSRFNHSCVDNTGFGFYDNAVVARAIRTIKKGEQCFVNYGIHFFEHSTDIRNAEIKKAYFFTCKCDACVEKWPPIEEIRQLSLKNLALAAEIIAFADYVGDYLLEIKALNEDERKMLFKRCFELETKSLSQKRHLHVNLTLLYCITHILMKCVYQGKDL